MNLQPHHAVSCLDQGIGNPQRGQHFKGARLNRQSPGLVNPIDHPVDDPGTDSEGGEFRRERQTSRPRSNDQNIDINDWRGLIRHTANLIRRACEHIAISLVIIAAAYAAGVLAAKAS
nr:hypothetical protein [Diaminobutyricimonas sp. LJ205]